MTVILTLQHGGEEEAAVATAAQKVHKDQRRGINDRGEEGGLHLSPQPPPLPV